MTILHVMEYSDVVQKRLNERNNLPDKYNWRISHDYKIFNRIEDVFMATLNYSPEVSKRTQVRFQEISIMNVKKKF